MPGATTARLVVLRLRNADEAVHDAPDRAEQADKGRSRADGRRECRWRASSAGRRAPRCARKRAAMRSLMPSTSGSGERRSSVSAASAMRPTAPLTCQAPSRGGSASERARPLSRRCARRFAAKQFHALGEPNRPGQDRSKHEPDHHRFDDDVGRRNMPQGERLCGSSRAGTGALSFGAGSSVAPGSGSVALGASAGGGVRAGAAGAEDAGAADAAAGTVAVGEASAAGGAEAGGATALCCGEAAVCANPDGEIARKPMRHRAGVESLSSNAIFRRPLTERIFPVLRCVAPHPRLISEILKWRAALCLSAARIVFSATDRDRRFCQRVRKAHEIISPRAPSS